jgi:hypothetical protein
MTLYKQIRKKYDTIIPDNFLRRQIAPSLFDEVFYSNPVGRHHIQILLVNLEFSIMRLHLGYLLSGEALKLFRSFIASL